MSERRHPPSPRRRAEARRQGLVAVSPLLVGAGAIGAATAVILERRGEGEGALLELLRGGLGGQMAPEEILGRAGGTFVALVAPPIAAAVAAAVIVGLIQTRGLLRFAWAGGGRALRSGDRLFALAASGLAIVVVALLDRQRIAELLRRADGAVLGDGLALVGRLALRAVALLAAAGLLQLLLRRQSLEASLRMTRGEVEAERREEGGDPRVQQERRRRLATVSTEQLRGLLRGAALVVTGDGLVVVIRGPRPGFTVAATAAGLVGARLVELARRQEIPVRFEAALARRLASTVAGEALETTLAGAVRRRWPWLAAS